LSCSRRFLNSSKRPSRRSRSVNSHFDSRCVGTLYPRRLLDSPGVLYHALNRSIGKTT
jgi:hypothetical protein